MRDLIRFGIAMEKPLLDDLDEIAGQRGANRSEVIRALVRAEVARTKAQAGVPAVGSLIFVYDHHVCDLTEKLTDLQHDLGDRVVCSLHIHLDHHNCMVVVALRGNSRDVQVQAEKLLATRGVVQGALHIVPEGVGRTHQHHEEGRKEERKRSPE